MIVPETSLVFSFLRWLFSFLMSCIFHPIFHSFSLFFSFVDLICSLVSCLNSTFCSFKFFYSDMFFVSFMLVVPVSSSVVYGLLFLLEIVIRLVLPALLAIVRLVVC